MISDTIITKQLFSLLDITTDELIKLISSADEKIINIVPFKNSWTAAQLAVHVTKSNKAIAQGLEMQGNPSGRDPEEKVPDLKKMFLDFAAKYKSPVFIVPEQRSYNKAEVVDALCRSVASLKHLRDEVGLDEIISLPAFGEITKLELLHFVLYHTQRHIRQLKKILASDNYKK